MYTTEERNEIYKAALKHHESTLLEKACYICWAINVTIGNTEERMCQDLNFGLFPELELFKPGEHMGCGAWYVSNYELITSHGMDTPLMMLNLTSV